MPSNGATEILEALERYVDENPEPIATATDISERIETGRRSTLDKLGTLAELGLVGSRKVGRARAFWPQDRDDQEEIVDDQEESDVDREDDRGADREDVGSSEIVEEAESGSRRGPSDRSGDELDLEELPETVNREAALEAIYAARDFLEEEGSATMREIVSEIMPDHPIGYNVASAIEKIEAGDRFRGAWWRRIVRPGLEEIDEIEKPRPGASKWRYIRE